MNMILAELYALNHLKKYRTTVDQLTNGGPIPAELDTVALSVLHIATHYGTAIKHGYRLAELAEGCIKAIDQIDDTSKHPNVKHSIPLSWKNADFMPFILSRLIFLAADQSAAQDSLCDLLSHHKSDVRLYCYKVAWIYRTLAVKDKILSPLLENIASTLGYVEYAVGLARSFFMTDEDFLTFADKYSPKEYDEQYRNRLSQLREGNRLASYQLLYHSLDIRISTELLNFSMNHEVPVANESAVQLKLDLES
jgi:hypothetical protein